MQALGIVGLKERLRVKGLGLRVLGFRVWGLDEELQA